jgi:hypothetical protein
MHDLNFASNRDLLAMLQYPQQTDLTRRPHFHRVGKMNFPAASDGVSIARF